MRSEMSLTVHVVVISSPATTRSPHSNSWPPWTSSAKLIATSGSNTPRTIAGPRVDDGEHRRRHDVGVAGLAGGLDVEVQRVGLADGVGVLLDLLAADRVRHGRVLLADRLGAHRHARILTTRRSWR